MRKVLYILFAFLLQLKAVEGIAQVDSTKVKDSVGAKAPSLKIIPNGAPGGGGGGTPSCHLSGDFQGIAGINSTYSVSCTPTTNPYWVVSCGTIISGLGTNTITVQWPSGGCSSSTVEVQDVDFNILASTTVSAYAQLGSGVVSPSSQWANYNLAPGTPLSTTSPTGGDGAYSYQWQSSPTGAAGSWSNISGATSSSYTPGPLTSLTYFQLVVSDYGETVTSNVVSVNVYPLLQGGSISPGSQTINYNTVPGIITSGAATGGNGTYSYQWWYYTPEGGWNWIPGANSLSYTPGALTETTIFLLNVTSNGVTTNGGTATVIVYPQLIAGSISPASQNINNNSTPASLTGTASTGGDGTYSYQWFYTPIGGTVWNGIPGATGLTYSPGPLTGSTYFLLQSISNGVIANVIATVNVYPPLQPGSISPASQTINYNTSASALTVSGATGGDGTYTYSWQSGPTSSGPYTQVGTGASYTPPGLLTSVSWYEVVTTSNGVSVTSAPVAVNVNPQVFPGTISPAASTIATGTSPGILTVTPASGGNCSSFSYQWQSSPDGLTWTTISGATQQSYSPGNLNSLTYYRVMVVCTTDTEYTASAVVNIGTVNTDLNYIRTRVLSKPGVTDTITADGLTNPFDVAQTTQYYDGLGRSVQTVSMQGTPLLQDIVIPQTYDNFGRESIKYLPYTAGSNDGNFKPTALADQSSFNSAQFPNEQFYYGTVTYEASLLNRPLESSSPGKSWVGSGRGISAQFLVNTQADSVQLWSISSLQLSLPVNSGTYSGGQLLKTIKTDQNGNQVVEYKDKLGKIILKKAQSSASPSTGHSGWLCTYYVYDTLQNLRVIMQPKAVDQINGSWSVNDALANELCFRYEYDGRRRLIINKVPGAGQVWMVYDARNRLVMEQDSAMRSLQKWVFVKYDAGNRADSTGLITDPSNYNKPAYHDSLAYYSTNYPMVNSYTNELLTQTFYDDYSWVSAYSAPVSASMAATYTTNSNYFITSYNVSPTYAAAITPSTITRGMPTGSMKKVIGTSSQYLYSVCFYDDRGRPIQTQSSNYTGAIDTITTQYSFNGAVLRTLINHKKSGNTVQNHIVLTKMDYDHRLRLKHIWKNIDGAASDQLIDSLQYNELGQLKAKYLGNNVDSLIYDYNIRGWLTGINKNYVAGTANHYFGMELGYDNAASVASGNTYVSPEYNGNIEGTVWKSAGSGLNRKYDYTYDNANRLTSGAFLQNTTGSSWDKTQVDFSVGNLSYDANGNILTMEQKGFLVGGSAFIDQLRYSYQSNSNKLSQVYDTANNPTSLLGDFHWSGTKQGIDYQYDGNGNMVQDNNKAITAITYNYLNLPQLVHMNAKGNIGYTYDAGGTKLSKVITDSIAKHSTTLLYIDGFVYQQTDTITSPGGGIDTLQFIAHEEGRVRWAFHKYTTGSTAYKFEYDFFEKDHVGNTRMVLTQERDTANYLASMEAAYRSTESQLFANITSTNYSWASVPGSSGIPSGTKLGITSPNDSVSKVDYTGTSGQKTGPSLLLKVMSGDTINMAVQCYYNSNSITTTNSSFNDVLNSLAAGLVGTATGHMEGTLSGFTSSTSPVYGAVNSFLTTKDPAPPIGYPKAYLNWVFLDDQFNYVSSSSGSVAAASSTYPAGQLNSVAPGSPLNITRNGYLYVWVSNETQGWDVFFDNLAVQHKQGPVLEENHYYPFGLTQAGISDKAVKTQYAENKYRYDGGAELQNKEFSDGTGLELYETSFRSFDPQLGRFFQIDPMADVFHFFSTYQYAGNNPISYNDPTGAYKQPSPFTFNTPDFGGQNELNAQLAAWGQQNGMGGGSGSSGGESEGSESGESDGDFSGLASQIKILLSNSNPYGGQLFATSNGTFNSYSFKSNAEAFAAGASALYLSALGAGDNPATSFSAAQKAYEQLTGENPGLMTPTLAKGSIWLSNGFIKITNMDEVVAQLAENGSLGFREQLEASETIEQTGIGLEWTDKAVALIGKVQQFKGVEGVEGIFKNTATGFTLASGVLTVVDAINNHGWQIHNTVDIVADAITFIPGVGEVFALGWFIGNVISESVSGRSLSANIQKAIEDNQ